MAGAGTSREGDRALIAPSAPAASGSSRSSPATMSVLAALDCAGA
jgi:hypothetical protein